MEQSQEWLLHEDKVCFDDRVARLDWTVDHLSQAEFLTFPGGLISKYQFEEARYCFVYGQFLATIVLGMAFLERTLAAWFFAAGHNDMERASISRLLREARNRGWLTEDEYSRFERIRLIRNPATHFRSPLSDETIEYRALEAADHPYALIEEDARFVLQAVMDILGRNAV
jgi:regulator of extracellular matrix RemA (YlzA/DUF370 family)